MKDHDVAHHQGGLAVDSSSLAAVLPRSGKLAKEVQALWRLNEASSRLWHVSSLEQGLQQILRASMALLGGDKGNVQLLDDNGFLRLVAHDGFAHEFLDFFQKVSSEDVASCGRALRTGQRVVVEDVETDELYAPLREVVRAAGYRAVQSTPIVNRDGRRLGMISTHFVSPHRPSEQSLRLLDLYMRQAADFIDRCRAEQQLRQSEQWLKALADIAPGTILWAMTPDATCSFITAGWHEYTGQARERALGMGWLEPIHVEDRQRVRHTVVAAAEKREALSLDYRLRRADGEFRWVSAGGRPRQGDGGEFLGFVGSVVDVHERKVVENALRDNEAILAGQKEAFQAAMSGQPLAACLNALVRTAVDHYGDARAA